MFRLNSGILKPATAFKTYRELLLRWNEKINLTSITELKKIDELHFFDSLAPLRVLDRMNLSARKNVSRETMEPVSILDLGAGAGFPGIPLKIVRPEISLTLIDSVKKKCDFMKEVVRTLQLKGVEVLHERIEDISPTEKFDLVVSRAAFRMSELIQLSLSQLRSDGWIVGMKSLNINHELAEANEVAKSHDMSLSSEKYRLPSGVERQLIIVKRK